MTQVEVEDKLCPVNIDELLEENAAYKMLFSITLLSHIIHFLQAI